jgi:hypothetical protein
MSGCSQQEAQSEAVQLIQVWCWGSDAILCDPV